MYEQAQQMNDYVIHCTSNFNPTLGHDPVTQNFERAAPNNRLFLIIIIIFIDKVQVIIIMVKLNIAMYSVIRAESAMTIRPLQYAL